MKKYMKNPCWKGFKAYGMKMKDGKRVPNCVPIKEELGKENEWGRPELTRKWLDLTPGQEQADIPPAKIRSLKEFMEATEEVLEEGLTPGGRIKKKLSAVRSRQKRKLAKNMSLGRTATPARIEKRAKIAARRQAYKKLLRGRSKTSLSAAERSSVEAILKRAPIQSSIKRAVIRLKPQYRSLETKRLARRRKK